MGKWKVFRKEYSSPISIKFITIIYHAKLEFEKLILKN